MKVRTATAGTANNVADLVGTQHLAGQFIEPLRDSSWPRQVGVTVIDGLKGISAYGDDLAVNDATTNGTDVDRDKLLELKRAAAVNKVPGGS